MCKFITDCPIFFQFVLSENFFKPLYRLQIFKPEKERKEHSQVSCNQQPSFRVLSRIHHLGEKSRVVEGHELPRGPLMNFTVYK